MWFLVTQHRAGKGWKLILRANREMKDTHWKLGLSAALLAGKMEGTFIQLARFQTTQNESFLDYPVYHPTICFPVYSSPPLFTHFIN